MSDLEALKQEALEAQYEEVEGEWVHICDVSCGWGHLHRTQAAADQCRANLEAWARTNGWVKS